MAEATKVTEFQRVGELLAPIAVEKLTNKSAANTALSVSTPTGKRRRFLYATVKYSASPTQTGVTVEIDNGVAADYDTILNTGSANLQNNIYIPGDKIELCDDDAIKVTAPAAGGAITSAIAIYTEV